MSEKQTNTQNTVETNTQSTEKLGGVASPEGFFMPREMADKYYGTLGRPLSDQDVMPVKLRRDRERPFDGHEVAVMTAARVANIELTAREHGHASREQITSYARAGAIVEKIGKSLAQGASQEDFTQAIADYRDSLKRQLDRGPEPIMRSHLQRDSDAMAIFDDFPALDVEGSIKSGVMTRETTINGHHSMLTEIAERRERLATAAREKAARKSDAEAAERVSDARGDVDQAFSQRESGSSSAEEFVRQKATVDSLFNATRKARATPDQSSSVNHEKESSETLEQVLAFSRGRAVIETDIPTNIPLAHGDELRKAYDSGFQYFGDNPRWHSFKDVKLEDRETPEAVIFQPHTEPIYEMHTEEVKVGWRKTRIDERRVKTGEKPVMIVNPATGKEEPGVRVAYQFNSNNGSRHDFYGSDLPGYKTRGGRLGNVLTVETLLPQSLADKFKEEIARDPQTARRFAEQMAKQNGVTDEVWSTGDAPMRPPYDQLPNDWTISLVDRSDKHHVTNRTNLSAR